MHKFSQVVSLKILGISNPNDRSEMISYGFEAILTTMITAISAFILCVIFNCYYDFFIFNICFIPIRMRHISFHFQKFINCFVVSNIMIVFCCITLNQVQNINSFFLLLYPALIIHYYLSVEKNKYEGFILAFIYTLSLFAFAKISLSIFLSVLINIILMIGRIYNEKINNYV